MVIFWDIPLERRSGYIYTTGITLGAKHAALKEVIEEIERSKVKRSMYAETRRERVAILNGIRESEWNAEMNPLVLSLKEGTLRHDFTQGPCRTSVPMTLRNYSLTHKCEFLLRLPTGNISSNIPPLNYTGRLTFRGTLEPLEATTIQPDVYITYPGEYGLGGWSLEAQVLRTSTAVSDGIENVRHRYRQESLPDGRSCLIVRSVHSDEL